MPFRTGVALLVCASLLWGTDASAVVGAAAQVSAPILPAPARIERRKGRVEIGSGMPIFAYSEDERWIARNFALLAERMGGPELHVVSSRPPRSAHAIVFRIDAGGATADPESYSLDVSRAGVAVRASDRRGLFYGAMTLLQLLTADAEAGSAPRGVTIEAMHIEDAPRFPWRGIMLDSARHYQTPQFIERFIDAMALLKLNVLQWHLVDDQGWRLEIHKYPRLTQVGAWRVPADNAAAVDVDATGAPRRYGGAYSQETVRRLVQYASLRGITIVPEIDIPGHASAAIAAYPELGVAPVAVHDVPSSWGVYPNLFNASDATFAFLTDVLDEVMALFPGRFIHVGGGAAVKDQWQASPLIQARMRALGVQNETALQNYFITRIGQYLGRHGRRLIGRDDILDDGELPTDAAVTSWRGVEGAHKAALAGHDAVLSPAPVLDFDNRQGDSPEDPPGRGAVVTLASVYAFDPLPQSPSPLDTRHILGLQANVWTEYLRTEQRVASMTFPRAAAVAEVGWSPVAAREYRDFLRRWVREAPKIQAFGITPSASAFDVEAHIAHAVPMDWSSQILAAVLHSQTGYGELRFTVDRREPTAESDQYGADLQVSPGATLRAASFDGGRRISPIRTFAIDAAHLNTLGSRELRSCTNKLSLALEDDAPIAGPRAVFLVDVMNPCWIYPDVDLSHGITITPSVGQVPFNFQLGADLAKVARHAAPTTPAGELEVRAGCGGERLAVLPLAPAVSNDAVTTLPAAQIPARPGHADLCFTFTQSSLDPMWLIDRIRVARVQSE